MLDRISDYQSCLSEPHRWAIATVAGVSGSVPRPVGTSMAVRDDCLTIGSVSGGCVEAAVVHEAVACITENTSRIADYGYSDGDAFAIGLTCGGDLAVLVQPLTAVIDAARTLLSTDGPCALVRLLPAADGSEDAGHPTLRTLTAALPATFTAGSDLPDDLAIALGSAAADVLAVARRGGVATVEITDRSAQGCPVIARLLVESSSRPPRVVIYGANDYSAALAQTAALLGRQVTVCDARSVFATAARHPGADEVIVAHPVVHLRQELAAGRLDGRTAVVLLTHDPKFDLPVLDAALRTDIGYIGAMGSRRTHERRAQELLHGGLPQECLDRLHSPIGLDIGARTPHEVAVAILAEIIAVTSGKDTARGVPGLHRTRGPVHAAHRPNPAAVAADSAVAVAGVS